MGSVTACFARVAKTLSPEDREAILKPIRDEITGRISAASRADPNADANAVALEVLDGMLAGAGGRATASAPAPAAAPAPMPEPKPERWRGYEVVPAPRDGRFFVSERRADGSLQNSAEFSVRDGKPTRIEHFYEAPQTRGPAEQAMRAWAASQPRSQAPAPAPAPRLPAPAPSAAVPTDADLAADKELQDALGHLGDVLGDVFGAKKNITGPQFGASDLLPALSRVVELLVRKGLRSFKAAVTKAAQVMRANAATAPHVDAITPRQWKAAYNAIAEGHPGTDSEEAVAAMSADEVRGLVAAPDQAQNPGSNATRPLDRPGSSALEGAPSGDVRAPGAGGNAGGDAAGSGGRDGARDANAGGAGRDADGSVGDGPAEPPAAGARGGRTGRASGGRRGVRNGGGGQSGAERPADAGRAGDVNPAPNAAPIQPPAFQPKDFTITDELALGEGGQKTKYRANVDAIRLLKDLDITGRAATVDEQQVLARYVGWGGLSQAFDGDNESWAREYAELKDLLTPDEYADARQSTRYAHYTSREIIGGMYSALRRLGFTGGRVLEPGGGVGNFLGLMPAELKTSSRATLIEREPIAAGIARHLYPQQNIQRADFAEFIGNDDYFDAAIGNPPFADTPLTDSSGRKHLTGLSVHNYFFAKSVDHLREGGVLAMVVTSSFLDARSDRARRYIAERTRFLGAIRLPNNAFSKNANTEVTTDIIFLQKRPEAEWGGKAAMQEAQAWLNTATVPDPRGGADLAINQYFADRPEMMLGTYGRYGTMYGPDQPALVAKPGQDTAALMQAAIANLPADVYVPPAVAGTDRLVDQTVVALKNPEVQEGGYYVEGDKLFQRLPDVAGEARAREITPSTQWTEKTTLGDVGYARLVALSQMRGTLRALLAAELSGAKTMEPLRGRLNKEYDAYVKEHGLLNDQATTRVFDDDPDFPLLASLEHDYTPGMGIAAAKRQGIKPYRSTAKKAPIFTQRVVQAREQVRRVETPADALAVSIAERGRIDSAYIGELLGRDSQQVLEELASGTKPLLFRDPATDEYVLRDAYLSGNVRTKLAQARQAGLFANARELEKVQPEDVGAADIYARIGSPWVPEDVYRDFALDLFGDGTKAAVVYVPLNSSFAVGVKPGSAVASSNTWGTAEYPGEDLLSALMNNREIKVTYRDQDGKTHVDQDATERANVKAQDIRNRFQDWLFADADRSEVLVRAYNDTNNNYVTRNYDGSWMTFPGKVPDSIIKFRRHQRNAISRIVQDRTALLDHVVGAGKTFTIVSAAMELKRTGLAKKPLIVVPNHLVKQWASDFYRLYPGANILTATKKDFAKANRRKFLAKIATGDWDAVVMAHSSFGFLRPAPDFEAQFNEGQVKRIVDTIKAVEDQDGDERAKKRTVKQLEALKERLENRIKSLRQKPIDNLLDYDQIGVDQLFVDEAHLFKNLMFTTKMQNIRGLGDSKGSQRAYDMYVKVAETYAKNGRGQGVVFATGTPVSNTLAEMYHMMRYLMPQAMEDLGFQSFDAWANTFASVNQEWDQKSSGDGFKAINTMSSFVNTHELLRIFDQVADTVTMEDIKAAFREENDGKEFPLPKLKTGRRQPVSLVKSTAQTQYMETIAARAAALERRKGPPQKGEDNALVIMTDARKAAMDVRLVEPTIIEREKGGRIDRAANEVLARWNQYADVKGTQLVFSDLGTPIKTVKAELREYQELQARMAPLADEDLVASAQLGDETAIGKLEDAEAARDELDKKGADWLTAIQAALRGFSVYDDLRAALVERGIPESQIAFIHDYNTDEQKAALFRKVNAGEIRVLMGSTAKLGAGTNVQERLVALHHLDVPWKPSDIEQREGRILRQGNRLEREVPAFEVEILAYVTQDTLDMKMWMIQERKLKMINQLRTRKIDREIENSFEDMEMSAGEMQAAATGNMDMLREIQLRTEVKKLEQRKRAFEAQRNDLESRRRRAEKEVAELPPMIERYDVAAAAADQYNQALSAREVPRSTINGETVTDRGEALKKLRGLADTHERALEERRMSLAEAYETAARQGRESGMAEGAAINAAEAAKQAMDKELPKPKMAVEFNGKTYGSKPALAQAATEFYGDAQPIEWTLPDGKVLNRRELITKALAQQVAESVSEESVVDVGRMGPFSVTIEGQRDRRGDKMLEVLVTPEGGEPESNLVYIRGDEDTRAARAAAEVVSAAEMMIFRASGQADYARSRLEAAKRALDDLKKTSVAGEWPEADKLAKARAAHRQVLDRLAGKRDASTNLRQTGRPEANETDVVFRVDSTDLPADTAAAYAAPTEDDQRAVQRLQFRIARYTPGVRLDAVAAAGGRKAGQPLQGADRARVAAAELLRALTGRRAVFFTAHRTNFINGVHSSSQPDVLFLRADASRPHMAVLGHEFLHGLRADRPDLYEALRERIRLVATGRAAHAADLQAKRQGFGQPLLSNDKLEEEFLADVMGDSWMDAAFWRDLAGKEPTGPLRRAFIAAFRFISNVLGKLADMNPFGTDVYLSDVRAARAAMAKALRDYVEVESVGAPEIGVDSFSADERAPWYSALQRAIAAQPMRGGGAGAWESAIKGLISSGKVRADEVEWSGLREWLAMQPGLVTRDAVGQYLKANGVQVQDITPAMREAAAGGMPMFSMAARDQTDTEAFRAWFKDSKVVDARGKPLVVYHGTRGDFTAFDGGRVKARFPNSEGFYFASSPRQASVYADSINNAAENFDPASRFIKPVAEGANVMPAYVSLQNPKFINVSEWGTLESAVDGDGGARVRAAKAAGHDGVIVERKAGDEYDGKLVIAFRPEQIKSATGNRGTFDPGEADINFSIAVDTLQSNDTARRLSERVIDVLRSDSTIGLLGRTVGTPYHLAHAKRADGSLRNPDLRKVYDEAQDYLNDINTFANDPAELAPGVVPMLNKWSDARRPLRLAGEQRAKLARALFEGTLGWTRDDQGNAVQTDDPHKGIEWTGTELRQRFGFNDADVKLYQQTRAAIGRSLDLMAGAEVARQMGGRDLPEGLRAMVSRGDTGRFKGLVLGFLTQQVDAAESAVRTLKAEHREQLARFAEATPGPDTDAMRDALKARQAAALEQAEAKLGKWKSLQAGVQKTYERVEDLKDRGYMPLMRFGPHTVTVRDIDTKEVVFFGMYETQAEANVEARKLRETAEPNEAVSRGEMSQEQWRLFKGMSPETVELFGQVAGIERTPVFEEYIRRTKANHSALKRLIQRKGTPGFSEDVQRVLAAFLTSNARAAAANLHAGAMEEATLDIDQERGLVKDYATKLTQYVQNPTDEAQWLRGLMFTQFIGGSVASAMVNMTQPFTMTLPWLSQHSGPVGAARLLTAGMRSALTRIAPDSDLGKAMARAEKDGIVSPQALHELQGQAVNRFGRTESALRAMGVSTKAAEVIDASLRRALFAWGGFFSLAEQFNRRATFIAAYQLAQEKGMADAFAFAEEAVTETQGQYSRANRPQWARGPVMSTVFTFKQFSIAYIEFLARLPRRERAIAMAVLLVAAGLEGLPFADDLDDLIDTIAQRLFGKAFSAKRAKVELLSEVLGRDGAEWVLRGASALPGFPVDLAGRMSLGNMIPGTGLLRTDGSRDKSSEVLEALGPAGGVLRDAIGEGSLVERFAPVAMRNAAKAVEMNRTGEYRDKLGRKVADVDTADAAAKGLGFQPREIARESRDSRMAQSVVAQTRAAESEIVRLWAQGIVDGEPDKVTQAQEQLAAWNERNPDARIAINRVQIARMARDMRATREDRVIRAAPKELRGRVAEELR